MNILIVDDENLTLEETGQYVIQYNYFDKCVKCKNAFEALKEAEKTKFDIALLDIEMPQMDGIELAERLFRITPDIRIIFVTAYNNYAAEAFEVNAIDYILKPIRKERLYKALNKLCLYNAEEMVIPCLKPKLYIQTLGKLVISYDSNTLKWSRYKSSEIFAYLLMNHDNLINKDKLCDELWPNVEPKKALANLQTAIWQLRKSISVFGEDQISIKYINNCYKLTYGNGYYDAEEFIKLCNEGVASFNQLLLEKAYRAYNGRYLEEEGWLWAMAYREELDLKYKNLLECLIENSLQERRQDKIIEYSKKLVELWIDDEIILKKYVPVLREYYGKDKTDIWIDSIGF